MTSSMLTGERRWASQRRGGMTIIGKVAVPKPINLPSQRLENHGLNPNVEIVPKGTLSWGSRSSPSASNAWGSSMLSPTTDGGSPSHLSGRPSSGGSGTRPSTASSDRAHEPSGNAWGPNSRPSSASGALTSNQVPLTSLRPRSAETRPGSSQLSRFAESSSENSVAWSASGIAEKLGVAPSKKDGFSLSSGDFPTLGSGKDNSTKNTEAQEHSSHGRPGSSSSGVPSVKDRDEASPAGDSPNANVKSGTVNTWRRDNAPQDDFRPNVEKWHGEPPPYQNANIPPQHFVPWHGPPGPGGVWYRGPPSGPPYGTPVAPSGFPMEYPYYHAQIPPTALANSQPVPPPGAGPRGPHPNTGDMYRPHIHDGYIRPGMPVRPGFFPGPMAYEGYFAPPMGYCNPNERDIQYMGMAAGPPVYNRHTSQNAPDSSKPQTGAGGYGSTGKSSFSEQVEPGHPQDPRGQYKVLLKHRNGWDGREEEQKWEQAAPTSASYIEKGDQKRTTSWEDDRREDYKNDEQMDPRKIVVGEEAASQILDNQGGASVPGKSKLSESVGNVKAVDDKLVKKSDIAVFASHEVSATPKGSTLIQKIEGLNAKARASDGQHDVSYVSNQLEQRNKLGVVDAKVIHATNDGGIISPASHETAMPRKSIHGVQGRVDHRGKGRFNTREGDGWQKKSIVVDSPSVHSALNSETSNVHMQDHHTPVEATEKFGSYLEGKDDGESVTSVSDPSDIQAQRAKMREIAKQRAKQLQKEEEERTKEQKAKALAKLEKFGSYLEGKDDGESVTSVSDPSDIQAQRAKMREIAKQRAKQLQKEEEERTKEQKAKALAKLKELNRRTQTVEGSTQKLDNLPASAPLKQEESPSLTESTISISKISAPNSALISNTNVDALNGENSICSIGEFAILTREPPLEAPKTASQDSVVMHNQSLPLQEGVHNADAAKILPQHHDDKVPKQKRMSYKQKQNIPSEKSSIEKSATSTDEAPTSQIEVAIDVTSSAKVVVDETASGGESSLPGNSNVAGSGLPVNSNIMPEPSAHQRRKNYRSGRNKHKQEETPSVAAMPSPGSNETDIGKASAGSGKPKLSNFELDPKPVQPLNSSKDAVQSFEQLSSSPNEESHGRVNNQWKSQNPRRLPRNQHVNRAVDKFHSGDAVVWAPVRSQNKTEVIDEASHNTVLEETVTLTPKSEHPVQNNTKNKRAEMERYVPKPKELAQQGSIQQPMSPSSNQTSSDDAIGRIQFGSQSMVSTQPAALVIGKVGVSVESRNGDNKQNKQAKKAHGSWRQRGSTESTRVQASQDGPSFSSKPSKDGHKSIEHNQPMKPDIHSAKVQAKSYDEWNSHDEWNAPNVHKPIEHNQPMRPDVHSAKVQAKSYDEWNTPNEWNPPDNSVSAASIASPAAKEQGFTSRGKRHPYKGQRVARNNNYELDHKNINIGDTEGVYSQSSALDTNETDRTLASKDNRIVGERSASHWQPKSQTYLAHNQRGNKPSDQNVSAEVGGRFVKKKTAPQDGGHPSSKNDCETSESMNQSDHEHSISEKCVGEASIVGHQDAKREKKVASFKGRPHSPNLGSGSLVESAYNEGVDPRHEQQQFPTGFRKNGNQNSRFGRGHESRKDWNSAGQDVKQHNQPASRERQRHNSHYEYQPVGPYNNNRSNNYEGQPEGSSRFKERDQNQRRGGGNFHGRQSGNIRVEVTYD